MERYEAEIYDLNQQVQSLKRELQEKDRECYNAQIKLGELTSKLNVSEKVIEDAGARNAMDTALNSLKCERTRHETERALLQQ